MLLKNFHRSGKLILSYIYYTAFNLFINCWSFCIKFEA